jgi:hypothetical protein
MTGSMHPARSMRPTGKGGCAARKRDGMLCDGPAVAGTDLCRMHPGKALEKHKAEGQVVVELSRWGINDRTLDPGITLLQLMTQAFYRAKLYGELLEQAYEAAETLRLHHEAGALLVADEDTLGGDGEDDDFEEPPSLQAARDTLDRVFTTGGVAALIGATYSATATGKVFATGEAIRGLVQLEAQERDRAAGMAAKAVAAGLATRQVELAERQGALVAALIQRLFADPELGLTPAQAAAAPAVAARHLRALSGGEPT